MKHATPLLRSPHSFPTRRSSDLGAGSRCRPRTGAERTSSRAARRHRQARHRPTQAKAAAPAGAAAGRSEEHTSELQSRRELVGRRLLAKNKVLPVVFSFLTAITP